jgi:hypothetical protein
VPLDAIAPWHALTSHIVGMAAHRTAPHLDDLANFLLPHMPKRVLASNNIRSDGVDERYSYRAMFEYAVTQPWISFDSPHWQNAIVVDVDDQDGAARIEQLATQYGVPRPVLVVDPWSGYSHAMWRLAAPVHEGAHKANRILAYASHMLAAALGGTPLPKHALCKNPWGLTSELVGQRRRRSQAPNALWERYEATGTDLMWVTIRGDMRAVALRDVVAALADDFGEAARATMPRRDRGDREPSALGRNCEVFDRTRWWSYDHKESNEATIRAAAEQFNSELGRRMTTGEVAGIARSIAKFMRTKYRATGKPRRDTRAGIGMSAAERRDYAGRETAARIAAKTDLAIAKALHTLKAAGQKLTQTAVAKVAGRCVRTIKGRWRAIEEGATRFAYQGIAPPPSGSKQGSKPKIPENWVGGRSKIETTEVTGTDPPRLSVVKPFTVEETLVAFHWLDRLAEGPVPQSGTIPYSIATQLWARDMIAPLNLVKRDDRGVVIQRIAYWRKTEDPT